MKNTDSFLVLQVGGITKWHNTNDWRQFKQYPHHNIKVNQQWFPQHKETAKTHTTNQLSLSGDLRWEEV